MKLKAVTIAYLHSLGPEECARLGAPVVLNENYDQRRQISV